MKVTEQFLKCYRFLVFRVYGLEFTVWDLGFRVHKALTNDFNKILNKSCKTFLKIL